MSYAIFISDGFTFLSKYNLFSFLECFQKPCESHDVTLPIYFFPIPKHAIKRAFKKTKNKNDHDLNRLINDCNNKPTLQCSIFSLEYFQQKHHQCQYQHYSVFEHEFHFKAISSLQVCSCVCVQPEVWEDKHWHNHIAPNQHQKKTLAPINNHFAPNQYKYLNRIEANEKDIL